MFILGRLFPFSYTGAEGEEDTYVYSHTHVCFKLLVATPIKHKPHFLPLSPSRPLSLLSFFLVPRPISFIVHHPSSYDRQRGNRLVSVVPPHTAVAFQKQRVAQHDTASAALRRSMAQQLIEATTKAVAMLPCRLLSTRTKSRTLCRGPCWQNRKQISASLVPRTGNTRMPREL